MAAIGANVSPAIQSRQPHQIEGLRRAPSTTERGSIPVALRFGGLTKAIQGTQGEKACLMPERHPVDTKPMPAGDLKSRSNLSWLKWITTILGVAALIALSAIGRSIAFIAIQSVIGIPIAYLLAAIPTVFLLSFLTLVIALALKIEGGRKIALAVALALGVMLLVPLVHNGMGRFYVNHLVKDDQTPAIEPWAGGTMGLVVPADRDVECNSLCQKMLGRGFAQRFIVASIPADSREIDAVKKAKAYHLEPSRLCKSQPSIWGLDPTFKLRLAQGACLVNEPAQLLQADAVLWHRAIHNDRVPGADMDPFKLPMAAKRLSFYRRRGSKRQDEVWRETSVRYATLFPLLIPTYTTTYGGMALPGAGWARESKTAGVKEVPEVEAFLQSQLQLDLTKQEVPDALLQQTVVDTILRQAAGNGGADPVRFDRFAEEFSDEKEMEVSLDRLKRLLDATVRDQRSAVSFYLAHFTAAAYRKSPEMGDAVADAMMDRLNGELPAHGPYASDTRERNLENLAKTIDAVPDQHFGRLWPRMRVIADNMGASLTFVKSIRRAWLADHPTPELLAVMDLQLQKSKFNDSRRRKDVLHPAMASLCAAGLAGKAGADALPGFAERLEKQGLLPDSLPQTGESPLPDVVGVANTLAALGADRDFIHRLHLSPYIASNLEPLIDRALSKPDCHFK